MAAEGELDNVHRQEGEEIMEAEEASDPESSGGEDSDDDEERQAAIDTLEAQLKANPYLYDVHVELIKILRQEGELDKLRDARENMNKIYPLAEDLWLAWLQDEMPLATTSAERQRVNKLFERAVKDYLSVPVWLEYVQYSVGGMGEEGGVQHIRQVFEQALTAAGLHVSKGAALWEAYREFESAILAGLQPAVGAIPSKEQKEKIDAQTNKILTIFRRQLTVPLFDMAATMEEYQGWLEGTVDNHVKNTFEKAKTKLEDIMPYEKALLQAEAPRYAEYVSYLAHEEGQNDPARIQVLYERAIQENCLIPELWSKYTKYIDRKLAIPHIVLSVYEKAVQNCPWSAELWKGYLLALERHGEPTEKVQELFQKALGVGFSQASEYLSLWTTYCDYLRRRIDWNVDLENNKELETFRDNIEKATTHLTTSFGAEGDPTSSLQQYLARIEAVFCKNMTKAREIWSDIMGQGHGKEAHMWLHLLNLERAYGNAKHCRKVLQRALNSASDWPESVFQAYIDYEREEGSLEQYDTAVAKVEAQQLRVNERRAKAAEKETEAEVHKKAARAERKAAKKTEERKERQKQEKPQWDQLQTTVERKRKNPEEQEGFKAPPPPGYKGKVAPPPGYKGKVAPPPGFKGKVAPPPGYKGNSQEPPAKKHKVDEEEPETAEGEHKHNPSKDDKTVFISNLNFKVDEERLKETFSKCGDIQEIRLVKNFHGKSKGYAYVEYKSSEAVAAALKLDREALEGRPMFVSPCEDRAAGFKTKQFKFSTGMEKCKLFIKGLPFTCTKEALENIFGQHGKLKDVRLVTKRSGAPKGIAFVEYEKESDAAHAVMKTDGLQLGEYVINVAISCPPERKTPLNQRDSTSFTPTLGSGKKETLTHGKARTMLSLMPRSVKKAQEAAAKPGGSTEQKPGGSTEQKAEGSTEQGNGSGDPQALPAKKMSNADFRSMLLKK